ncbi:MAG: T9SS type A sorting domain-containing protein, partial [Bacteroidales bacterium]|nr:T9SS type A sorting domain-containing protein [Bacteroidales bacterium]
YTDSNFTNLTQAGTYYTTLANSNACDSIVAFTLYFYPVPAITQYSANICHGGIYSDSNFTNLTQEGYYSDTLQTPDGCDSIVALSLSVHIPSPTYLNASMCRGGIYSDSNFTNITESGTYYDTLQDIYGCDSVLILYVSYYPTVAMTYHSATICHGNIYSDSNFINLTESGTYYDTLQNINGCDSIIRLTLYASYISTPYYYASICNGDSYSDSNFSNLTQEGYYSDTLQTPDGCDSIVRLRLTYKQSPTQALCMISVEENNHNQIVWKNNEIISAYKIYREGTQSGIYDCIATVDYDSNNVWIDTASNATERSYRYKISGIDTCGNESDLSAFHKTMHLTINQGVGSSWNLIWTPYEGITYPTLNIYRSSGVQMGNLELIQTISGNNTSYTDNNAPSGYVYYQIEIVLDEPCTTRKSFASIRSNIATNAPNTNSINEFRTSEIQLYPNPTSSQLKIKNYQIKDGENVEIIDVLGRVQKSTIINQQSEIIIDVSHLAKGMYFIKIGNWRGKFVVN